MAINKFGKAGFDSADKSFQGLGTLNGISQFTVFGCTDDTQFSYTHPLTSAVQDYYSFFNFNPGANTDDGSCAPTVLGCLDPSNNNYDIGANLDATPTLCEVLGCIDSTAFNYDPNANTDDGSCIPVILGCIDGSPDTNVASYPNHSHPTSSSPTLTINAYDGNPDNTDYSLYVNYDNTANTDDGSCIQRVYGCMQLNALMYNYDPLANTEPPGFCLLPILGCMDPVACNEDPTAQLDDGSCEYCSDNGSLINVNGADNYDGATCGSDTGGCQYCTYVDIQNSSTISYSNSVHLFWTMPTSLPAPLTITDGSVAPVVSYEIRYRNLDVSGSSFITAVSGLSPNTTDYHVIGLDPDTRYRFQIRTNCANTHSGPYSGAAIQKKTLPPSGCTDPNANNFYSLATVDDGSCVYVGCTDPLAFNPATGQLGKDEFTHPDGTIYYASIENVPSSCVTAVHGCTNPAAGSLYNPLANIDDNSCPTGCMDNVATNYDSSAIIHDNSCTYVGCTDPTASNYSFADSVGSTAGTVNLNTTNYGYGIIPNVPENDQYVSSASGLTETGTVTDNSSCTYDIVGCTNPNANNYFATATTPCNLGTSDNDCCAFGSINSGVIGSLYDLTSNPLGPQPLTGSIGWAREGCMDPAFDNYNMTAAGANQTATVPIYSDPHVSLMNPGTSEGCLNFSTDPITVITTFGQGHPSFTNNLLEQTGGSNTAANVPQQSHGIKFQLACNNSSGGCPDLNFGFVDPTAATTSTLASNDKLLVEVYNMTTGSRVVNFGDSSLQISSDNSNGIFGSANAGPVDFWGENLSTGYLVIPRSTAPSPTAIDFSNPTSGGAGQSGVSGQAAFNNIFAIPAKWLASKPRFLFDYVEDISNTNQPKTDLITDAQSGTYYSDSSGNVAFTQTLHITFKTGFGNIISGHDLDVKVGCTDPNAANYCPSCNAMQKFSQYEPNDPLSTTNWTICDYQ